MLPRIVLLLVMLLSLRPAVAAIEEVQFSDPAQLARYKALIADLRCPKCLNANLAGSDAPIAADLRAEVHKQIQEGKSDREILDFLVARYGEFILYDPPLHIGTALLWFGPPALLILGLFLLRRMVRTASRDDSVTGELSGPEQQQLRQLLAQRQQEDSHD